MNANAELLNFIYQNSQMGVETMAQLVEAAENPDFKEHLRKQLEGYEKLNGEAKELLNKNGYDEKGISAFEKISAYVMVNMKTLTDKSTTHIAGMLLKGSDMGIIDAIKKIKKYENSAEKDILSLMNKLLTFEESNVEQLKKFL